MAREDAPLRPSLVAAVIGNPLLAGLAEGDRELLAAYITRDVYAPGEAVIAQGDQEREMFFVLAGTARIRRDDLDLGTLAPGDIFGELGLLTGKRWAASIVASSPLSVARLTLERYDAMASERPELALRFLRALVTGLGNRLGDVTDTVDALLRERSLPRRTHVRVTTTEGQVEVRTGTPVESLLPTTVDGRAVVAGLLDRRAVSLVTPISSDCTVTPLTTAHMEGHRIYTQSLALLLLEAAARLSPPLDVHMAHSVGVAQRVIVPGMGPKDGPRIAAELQRAMETLVVSAAPLREEIWTVDEARAHFAELGQAAADLLRAWRDPTVPLVTYGKVYALRTGPLLPSASALVGFRVVADDSVLLLVHGEEGARPGEVEVGSGDELVREARAASQHAFIMTGPHDRWLAELGITSLGKFNYACIDGDVSQLIRVAEGFHEKRISEIADQIRDRAPDVKVICVAGPSSSGKTTSIKRLKVQLQVSGMHPVGISLDDYYVDREATPLDEAGEYDFEAFEALNVELFQEHLSRLLQGEVVRTAHYSFKSGNSDPTGGREIALQSRDILMLEGIHGLNPRLTQNIPDDRIYRIFICPLAQLPFDHLTRIHASDVRLLRRIIRDRHSRGSHAASNIRRWPSVRRGERRHIFPYQHHADAVFDSSLIYELSVLKVFAERYLLEVPHDDPAYATAYRLLHLLDRFVTIYPDHVPPTSILREFIGGSGFEY